MTDQYWLSEKQLTRIKPCFPRSHGVPRVDDRRVLSGIIHVLKRGLQWRDAPAGYGPHRTLYNRFVRWSRLGVFDDIFKALSSQDVPEHLQVDATHLKAQRTACSLLKKGMFPATSDAQKAG
jgi:putative transposase